MGVPFRKPKFRYSYDVDMEEQNLDQFFTDPKCAIPKKKSNQIDLATWNIANLRLQSITMKLNRQ